MIYGAVFAWVALGTLLMVYVSAMAVLDPRLHFGLGIVELMGARALLASLPLAVCGLAGLWLLLRRRSMGPYLLALFSLTLTVCLGVDAWRDFDSGVAVIAGLYLVATAWSIWTARQGHTSRRARAAAAGSERMA